VCFRCGFAAKGRRDPEQRKQKTPPCNDVAWKGEGQSSRCSQPNYCQSCQNHYWLQISIEACPQRGLADRPRGKPKSPSVVRPVLFSNPSELGATRAPNHSKVPCNSRSSAKSLSWIHFIYRDIRVVSQTPRVRTRVENFRFRICMVHVTAGKALSMPQMPWMPPNAEMRRKTLHVTTAR
jgi:hypothetical protein